MDDRKTPATPKTLVAGSSKGRIKPRPSPYFKIKAQSKKVDVSYLLVKVMGVQILLTTYGFFFDEEFQEVENGLVLPLQSSSIPNTRWQRSLSGCFVLVFIGSGNRRCRRRIMAACRPSLQVSGNAKGLVATMS